MQRPLTGLTWGNAVRESLAGVTLLAIAVPLNIGYAQIAGLPPTAGLYALIVPAVLYALVVSSRQLVASPDAAAAALVASSVGGLALAGSAAYPVMAMAQAIISGALFMLASVFKLGFLANFLSKPILVGFVGGLALDILVSQMAKMLGVRIDSGAEFVTKVGELAGGLGSVNAWSVLISVLAVALLLFGRRFARAVPWALVVLVVATVVVVLAGLEDGGVAVLGPVAAGPPALTWPVLDWGAWLALIPSAIALTMVTMGEGLLVARSYADKNGYPTSPNRELLALGVANVAAGASGSFAIGASTSRTAAMDQAGSRTQLPGLITAVGTLALLLFGTGLLEHIPSPAIGAIVGVAILPLLGVAELRMLWRQDKGELAVAVVCFAVTLFVGAIAGIVVAFVLALINVVRRASTPAIDVLAADGDPTHSLLDAAPIGTSTAPGVLVIRLAAPLFFANAAVFVHAVEAAVDSVGPDTTHQATACSGAAAPVRRVVLDLEAVTDVDVTAAEAVVALKVWLSDRSISLGFSRVRAPLERRMRLLGVITSEKVFADNRSAIAEG